MTTSLYLYQRKETPDEKKNNMLIFREDQLFLADSTQCYTLAVVDLPHRSMVYIDTFQE